MYTCLACFALLLPPFIYMVPALLMQPIAVGLY